MNNFFLYTPAVRIALSLSFAVGSLAAGSDHDHSHDHEHVQTEGSSHLHSLEVTVEPQRDGMVDVEQRFRFEVDGVTVKRGPILRYMTVFASSGGLILDTTMEIVEVLRGGKTEPFRILTKDGTTLLYLGSENVILEPGAHDYLVRYRRLGSWKKEGGDLVDSIDVTEAFRQFPIDRVTAKLVLPTGTEFTRRSAAVYGTTAEGPGFSTVAKDGVLSVETTAPLNAHHSLFLNTAWSATGFSGTSKWSQIFLQHPRIPMAAIGSIVLGISLWILVSGGVRRAKQRRLLVAATA